MVDAACTGTPAAIEQQGDPGTTPKQPTAEAAP